MRSSSRNTMVICQINSIIAICIILDLDSFDSNFTGKMSIGNNPIWLEPFSKKDEELTEIAREFGVSFFSIILLNIYLVNPTKKYQM